MELAPIDWIIIVVFLLISLLIGLRYRKQAGKSLSDFFLGGRNLPWYIAGISMVATTFAADTPLAVSELVSQNGVSGNWLWWSFLTGGMLTTFFFARLWRKAGVLTELELIEMRYSGKKSRFLRLFKSVYLGLFMNCLVIGWVNIALNTLLVTFFGIPESEVLFYTAGFMGVALIYSLLSGLMGVVITDVLQFGIAIIGTVILAVLVLNSDDVGGIANLKEQLPESYFNFFPSVAEQSVGENASNLGLTIGAFLSFVTVQWWASWYPGAEPGGGGYIVQRMLSTKNEKHSVFATLFFQIAHYCLRPWPWIIVGLCAVYLYSAPTNFSAENAQKIAAIKKAHQTDGDRAELFHSYPSLEQAYSNGQNRGIIEKGAENPGEVYAVFPEIAAAVKQNPDLEKSIAYEFNYKSGYVQVMLDYLPPGLVGLLLVAFIAAYMSTISTQLNWGASYLINDFILPLTQKPDQTDETDARKPVFYSRLATVIIALCALITTQLFDSISGVWSFILECGAGLGLVLILRWYWWRINAWSEITASLAPFIGYSIGKFYLEPTYGNAFIDQKGTFLFTVGFTTISWLVATFLTQPTNINKLVAFYNKVQPDGLWGKVSKVHHNSKNLLYLSICWISSIIMVYGILFGLGKLIFMEWKMSFVYIFTAFVCFLILKHFLKKSTVLE